MSARDEQHLFALSIDEADFLIALVDLDPGESPLIERLVRWRDRRIEFSRPVSR